MNLDKFYSLRTTFTILGLTGRVGSGCSEIADKLSQQDFNKEGIDAIIKPQSLKPNDIKSNICVKYISNEKNWNPFKKILYKDVLLFHVFFHAVSNTNSIEDAVNRILETVYQNDPLKNPEILGNRFCKGEDSEILTPKIEKLLRNDKTWYNELKKFNGDELNTFLSETSNYEMLFYYYFRCHENLASKFYEILNSYEFIKRTRFAHDIANNLRNYGKVISDYEKIKNNEISYQYIYTTAETINRIIKCWRYKNKNKTKIVIDSLKNSREAMYFKEKFSAFYMIATNKSEEERIDYLREKLKTFLPLAQIEISLKYLKALDESEYKGDEVNNGEFASPDIINCIQISDYHIFYSNREYGHLETPIKGKFENLNYEYISLKRQLVKLVSLIQQPGIVTPTAVERSMQIAFNAKLNSGCISRQVGALVADQNFSVKAIGWNDVPQGQLPCNLRSVNDLISKSNIEQFSDFELGIENSDSYDDGSSFLEKLKKEVGDKYKNPDLHGRNCSFCFKSFHNAFEGEKNQVHTRSLHSEENAMLQISKSGGQGLKGGKLFTTASPCELCSKKAFQLGILDIYFIDPYPGISKKHILKGGVTFSPRLLMFQGAVGRSFHKLYEPFMAYKDELSILTDIRPKATEEHLVKKITNDEKLQAKILKTISDHKK